MAFMRKPVPDVTGYATPERAALAHAIAAHAAAVATVAATDDAGNRASQAVWDAQSAVTEAMEGLPAARDAMVNHLVAAAGGDDGPAPRTEREARAALADAEAALDAARAARDALKGRLPGAERERDWASMDRTKAARAVIAAEAAGYAVALAGEVEALQRQSLAKGAALGWLVKAGALPVVTDTMFMNGRPADPAIRDTAFRHEQTMAVHSSGGWNSIAAAVGNSPWDDALATLERNAAAPLPLGGA